MNLIGSIFFVLGAVVVVNMTVPKTSTWRRFFVVAGLVAMKAGLLLQLEALKALT